MKNVVNVSEAQKWISQMSLAHSMFRDSKFKKKKREWKNSWKQIQMELHVQRMLQMFIVSSQSLYPQWWCCKCLVLKICITTGNPQGDTLLLFAQL